MLTFIIVHCSAISIYSFRFALRLLLLPQKQHKDTNLQLIQQQSEVNLLQLHFVQGYSNKLHQ